MSMKKEVDVESKQEKDTTFRKDKTIPFRHSLKLSFLLITLTIVSHTFEDGHCSE